MEPEFADLSVGDKSTAAGHAGSDSCPVGSRPVGWLVVGSLVLGLSGVADLSDVAGVAIDVVLDSLDTAVGEQDCKIKNTF